MRDPEVEENGYKVIGLLSPGEAESLAQRAIALLPAPSTPFHASSVSCDRSQARAVDQELKALVRPALARLLPGLEPFLAAFITKGLEAGYVEIHQDWTYHDERVHRSTLVWCPLVDVDEHSGALHVIPGSHRWSTAIRGSGTIPGLGDDLQAELWRRARPIPLRAGQAIAYDPAILHGSTPVGPRIRPAAAFGCGPAGAPLLHFTQEAGHLRGGWVDESWFTTVEFAHLPPDAPPVEPWTDATQPMTLDELQAHDEP